MFDGGFTGFVKKLRQGDVGARMDAYYEAQNAAAEAAGELTLAEVAWAVGLARADGKRTANETALIAELKRLHAESKRAPALV